MAPTQSGPAYADRGTGYNYFNGTTWMPNPTVRIEAARVGWGNIVNTRTGKELILSHNGALLNLASRATKGSGTFVESLTTVPSATTAGNYWPRTVSAGDTVYAISVTQRTDATPPGALYQGLNGAVCFSRSKNAGATWDIVNTVPAGLGTSNFLGHGGDAYAIAAKGSTVVVVAGDSGKDLVLSKSTDAGATWVSKVVMKFPIALWDPATMTTDKNGDNVADTIVTSDGNLSVGLDNNNQAYVFYGRARILQTAAQANGSYSYFPGTDGLMMWKESFAANTDTGGILVAAIDDIRTLGVIELPNPASGLSFGRWGSSLTSYPSVAFDASNTMYLSYSSVVDSLFSLPNPDKALRHTYIIKSTDGGINWTNPCDISGGKDDAREGIFGSMAKKVDGFVHIIYQRDFAAGNGIPGTGTSPNPDEAENTYNNDIVYVKIPVGDIGTCVVPNSVKEISSSASSINFYPNPASTIGTVEVVLTENAKMDVVILNSVGQTVYSTSVVGVVGANKVDINTSNLSSGLYFYQVRVANSKSLTQKFVIEK